MSSKILRFILLGVVVVLSAMLFNALHSPSVWKAYPLALFPRVWRHAVVLDVLQALVIVLATSLIVRWDLLAPLSLATEWMKDLRLGAPVHTPPPLPKGIFEPLAKEVTHLAKRLSEAQASAVAEARLRQTGESLWTPERLREYVRQKFPGKSLLVVSNREPYMHHRNGKGIQWETPASGLVTALEPLLRACGGTWLAQATGDADREVVDEHHRLQVPPDSPAYTLRRLWITPEEERGFYYGFSNEGLWPLCHIAHTRPIFRPEDWQAYQEVNQRFADAALEELKDVSEPFVLVQDYHFALLPRMIKEKRPDARIALFWHIPWPNPESFGICPWRKEVLLGMLGADLLGFHIQYHCNHFLDTVDQVLESRIDWERYTVNRQGHTTWIKPFPISIAFTTPTTPGMPETSRQQKKEELLREYGLNVRRLAVGVDRIDYTKGILERLRAVEQLLDSNPTYQNDFAYVELGAPSRTLIKRYDDFNHEVEAETARINQRFQTASWQPILFLRAHHTHATIDRFYRVADVCLVTSLHDGMNLVAKEYVAARDDEDGVLILSRFTGASRELRDALIVNPYDIDQVANTLHEALEMPLAERQARMRRMRETIAENNIYRWGAELFTELSRIRISVAEPVGRV